MMTFLYYLWLIPALSLITGVSILGTVWIVKTVYEIIKDIIKY